MVDRTCTTCVYLKLRSLFGVDITKRRGMYWPLEDPMRLLARFAPPQVDHRASDSQNGTTTLATAL
jgi:hypothetical protein